MKSFENIRNDYDAGVYKPDVEYPAGRKLPYNYEFDPEKSINWNRNEVIKHNDNLSEAQKAYAQARCAANKRLENDLILAGVEYVNGMLTESQVCKIYNFTYEEHHGLGISDIIHYFTETLYLFESVLKS